MLKVSWFALMAGSLLILAALIDHTGSTDAQNGPPQPSTPQKNDGPSWSQVVKNDKLGPQPSTPQKNDGPSWSQGQQGTSAAQTPPTTPPTTTTTTGCTVTVEKDLVKNKSVKNKSVKNSLVMLSNGNNLVTSKYSSTQTVTVTIEDEVLIDCPSGVLKKNGKIFESAIFKCIGNELVNESVKISTDDKLCCEITIRSSLMPNKNCQPDFDEYHIVNSDENNTEDKRPVYTTCFNKNLEQLDVRVYSMALVENPGKSFQRNEFMFHNEGGHYNKDIHLIYKRENQPKIENSDFWNKGHLTPSADFNEHYERKATYHYNNIVPQLESCNGGEWRILEEIIRDQIDSALIFTGTLGPYTQFNVENSETKGIISAFIWKVVNHPNFNSFVFLGKNRPNLANTICTIDKFKRFEELFTEPEKFNVFKQRLHKQLEKPKKEVSETNKFENFKDLFLETEKFEKFKKLFSKIEEFENLKKLFDENCCVFVCEIENIKDKHFKNFLYKLVSQELEDTQELVS